jgi:hypothetical protein
MFTHHRYIGELYFAHDILSGQHVVVKLEPVKEGHCTLEHEFHVYKRLGGGIGVPCVHWFGTEGGFNAMVIDRLGPSLEDLFVRCRFQFTVQTVLLLARQLVRESYTLLAILLMSLFQGLSPAIHSLSQLPPPQSQAKQHCHGCRQACPYSIPH